MPQVTPRPAGCDGAGDPGDALQLRASDVPPAKALDEPVHVPAPSRPPSRYPRQPTGGAWTIPLLCAGLSLIACSVLIPAADENRRLVYERQRLDQDLKQVQNQLAVNDEFLKRIAGDPTLLERLAQRQMRIVRQGASVLELPGTSQAELMSPYTLVKVPPPAPMPEYRPVGGALAAMCRNPRSQLYLSGLGLLLMAAGLVLGSAPPPAEDHPAAARAAML